jgi:hypothetical protein
VSEQRQTTARDHVTSITHVTGSNSTLERDFGHSDRFLRIQHVSSINHYVLLRLPSLPSTLAPVYNNFDLDSSIQFPHIYRPTQPLPAANPQSLPPTTNTQTRSFKNVVNRFLHYLRYFRRALLRPHDLSYISAHPSSCDYRPLSPTIVFNGHCQRTDIAADAVQPASTPGSSTWCGNLAPRHACCPNVVTRADRPAGRWRAI